jgi:hypothetical protein
MRDPKKKCIAKKCEECHFFQSWDMTNDNGLRKSVQKCSLQVLCEEIPHMRGSIDGCQQATNETQNRVLDFGNAAVQTLEGIRVKQIEGKNESGL